MKRILVALLLFVLASPALARSDKDECWRRLNHGLSRQDVFSECGSPSYREYGQGALYAVPHEGGVAVPVTQRQETWIYDYSYEDERSIVIEFKGDKIKKIREGR
jgi:hypothetical protein